MSPRNPSNLLHSPSNPSNLLRSRLNSLPSQGLDKGKDKGVDRVVLGAFPGGAGEARVVCDASEARVVAAIRVAANTKCSSQSRLLPADPRCSIHQSCIDFPWIYCIDHK